MQILTQDSTKLLIILLFISSCTNNPLDEIQGTYQVDKNSLKELMNKEMDTSNALATSLIHKAVDNALIEVEINGDSLNGILFMMGESTVISSKISIRNDSFIVSSKDQESYLTPTEHGVELGHNNLNIQLKKTSEMGLSNDAKQAIVLARKKDEEEKSFERDLGFWKTGNIVDEFGDKTGTGYPYCLVRGVHENSITTRSEVYVKAIIEEKMIYFQIFNKSMSMKENFPNKKFGTIKIKYSDGNKEEKKAFFLKNVVAESPNEKNPVIYNHVTTEDSELKILIDLSTASDYYSDKYQFSIKKNNLKEVLDQSKK